MRICTRVSRRRKCRVAGAHKIEEELLAVEVAATSGYVTAVSIPNLRERGTFVVAVQHAVHGSVRATLHLAIAEVKKEFFAVEVSLRNVHHQTGPTEAATVRRAYRLQTSHNGSITRYQQKQAQQSHRSVREATKRSWVAYVFAIGVVVLRAAFFHDGQALVEQERKLERALDVGRFRWRAVSLKH